MLYNTKAFVLKLFYLLLLVFAAVISFFYYKGIEHKKQVKEIVLMRQFLTLGKAINLDDLKSSGIKNKNILSTLILSQFQKIKDPSLEQVNKYNHVMQKLNPETNIKANAVYTFGIAYINLKSFDGVVKMRQMLSDIYKETKNSFVFTLQKHYDVNILSSSLNFTPEQFVNLQSAINKMNYLGNAAALKYQKNFDEDILHLYK